MSFNKTNKKYSMVNSLRRVFACLLFGVFMLPSCGQAANLIPNPNAPGAPYVSVQAQPCTKANIDPSKASVSQPADAACTLNRIGDRFLFDLFYLMGAVAVIMLVYSGFLYIQANGNAEATKKARQNILNVILGIVLLTASYTIVELFTGAVKFFKP